MEKVPVMLDMLFLVIAWVTRFVILFCLLLSALICFSILAVIILPL